MSRERDLPARDPHVLVVDDDPDNRMLLRELLAADDYRVSEAADGAEAIRIASARPPDVVLLDVLMPGLDGIEVCKRLKSDPATATVPVILVTAQRGRDERLAGIGAGATDFLTKPVDVADLRLRVRNAVAAKRLYDQVEQEYQQVRELERHRDNLVNMLVRDLRSPLSAIVCDLQLLQKESERVLHPDLLGCVGGAIDSARFLTRMIGSILDVNRLESGAMPLEVAESDIGEIVREARASLGPAALRIRVQLPEDELPPVTCDRDLMRRVVTNLLENAIQHSPDDQPVEVGVQRSDGAFRVTVTDHGEGIPLDWQERIFEKFRQLESSECAGHGTGLGLTFCRLAIEALGGRIGVTSHEGTGSTFWLELPESVPAGCVEPVNPIAATA